MVQLISFDHYLAILDQPALAEMYSPVAGTDFLCVDTNQMTVPTDKPVRLPSCPVIAVGAKSDPDLFDVQVAEPDALAPLLPNLTGQAQACAILVQLLRHNAHADIDSALLCESLCYSTLQQAQGFRNWLANRQPHTAREDSEPVVLSRRTDSTLVLTLNRPRVHNAYNTATKDALCSALQAAHADRSLAHLHLRGNGPSFCAGGDLTEFGQVSDAGQAHLSRTTRGAGSLLAHLPCTTAAYLHGACIGAGIELPAFADHVEAAASAYFQLPEVAMGLVPGAGGTASITRRVGRQRTAWMAISGQPIDAPTALRWGLIDALV